MRQDNPGVKVFPVDGKIADLTHADTLEHTITNTTMGLDESTVAIEIYVVRIGGTGKFQISSVSGGARNGITTLNHAIWFKALDGLYYYRLNVAGDDWDIFGQGYWVDP